MNTSLNKTPKKRKSLAPTTTPLKLANEETPKNKTPKGKKNKTPALNQTQESSSPKTKVSPKQPQELQNGGSPKKLEKFKGTKKQEKVQAKKEKKEKLRQGLSKRGFIIQKLKERVDQGEKDAVIKSLNEKIDEILARTDVTKTGKKKIKYYKHLIKSMSGEITESGDKKPKSVVEAKKGKDAKKKPQKQNVIVQKKEESESDDDEEEEEDDSEESGEEDEEENGDIEETNAEESEDDDSEDDDDENDDEEENDSDEEEEAKPKKAKIEVPAKKIEKANQNETEGKKSRYVLFVGNIAYDTTKKELEDHFSKVGDVADVRIPTEKESNRPRGFAYVELSNEAAYQKALDLNGSQLKNRKIKVEYTQGGKAKSEDQKKNMKAKNFKLHAMRKQGQFGKGDNKGKFKGGFKGKGKKSF